MKSAIYRILTVVALTLMVSAGAWPATVAEADSAYKRGDYAAAVEAYRQIVSGQGVSSELYYNLGNAYAKGGDNGRALISYVRALRLDPANSDAKANISYIESKVAEANKSEIKNKKLSVVQESPSFFSSVKRFIARDHLSDTWALWAVVTFLLTIGCLALYIFTRNVMARKVGFFGALACLAICVLTLTFSFMAASYTSNEGVIVGNKVKLRSDPNLTSKENTTALIRGTRMSVLDSVPLDGSKAQWYKVRLNSDFIGWIAADDFETIGM